ITNLQATTGGGPLDIADVVVTYGTRTETFRHVTLNPAPPPADAGNTLEKRIGTADKPVSSLVTVSQPAGDTYPTAWPGPAPPPARRGNRAGEGDRRRRQARVEPRHRVAAGGRHVPDRVAGRDRSHARRFAPAGAAVHVVRRRRLRRGVRRERLRRQVRID